MLLATRCVCALLALAAAGPAAAERAIEGTWRGTLLERLRLVVTIARSAGPGGYSAVLYSVDQGNQPIPIDKVTLTGDELRLEVESVHGVYQGKLSADGGTLNGTWTQGAPAPLTLVRDAPGAKPPPAPPPTAAQRPLDAPIDVLVPHAPTAFAAGGKLHLVYELHVTSFSRAPLGLVRVEASSADGQAALGRYEGSELEERTRQPGAPLAVGAERLRLQPGARAVIFLWLTVDGAAAVPAALRHRVTVSAGEPAAELAVDCARAGVGREVPVVGPPLRGDGWVAANGPSNGSAHRRALIATGGRARIGQRFAIDWVRALPSGKTYAGDAADNKSYRAYGAEALAVASGTVVAVKDGIPENVPGATSRAVPMTLETLGGNQVALDLGQGRFAFYGHLQPGSLRVKPGDAVVRGRVLGLVGNSGNSTEPHLHFHVADGPLPLGAEGVPWALDAFEVQPDVGQPGEPRTRELPTENQIVRFP